MYFILVCTLFIGTYMTRAELDLDAKWIVLVFILIHISVEIILTVISYIYGEESGKIISKCKLLC